LAQASDFFDRDTLGRGKSKQSAAEHGEPRPGDVVARKYEIKSVLDSGGMGLVYLAEDRRDKRKVVLKIIRKDELERNPENTYAERFEREAHGMSHFTHPNIVEILDYDLLDATMPFIVMEFIDGVTLKNLISKHPKGMSLDVFLKLFNQLASALQMIHEKGIIHRDLKPANIMIGEGNRLKILDFGLIFFHESVSPYEGLRLTKRGELVGTPMYMAPEQILGKTISQRSDIYALGLLSYEILTGKQPFSSTNLEDLLKMQISEHPESLASLRSELPAYVCKAISISTQKSPSNRYKSCFDFWQALNGVDIA